MMGLQNLLALLLLAATSLAFPGEYIPKSYYVIDHNGHKSDVIYFRSKRDVEQFPLLRLKRGGGSSSSSQSHSSASASSSSNSNSNSGGGGIPFFPGENDYFPGFLDSGFSPDFFKQFSGGSGGGSGAQSHSFASSSSSSSSGVPSHGVHGGGARSQGNDGPALFSRFGEDTGTGVKVSGSAAGPKGAFSSSSSSIDSNGKISYSVKSGKY